MYLASSRIDEMFRSGHFEEVESALLTFNVDKASPSLLVSMLSSTLAAKDRLPTRHDFFKRAKKSLKNRGALKEGLLNGLE
jgi:hypothetical protein